MRLPLFRHRVGKGECDSTNVAHANKKYIVVEIQGRHIKKEGPAREVVLQTWILHVLYIRLWVKEQKELYGRESLERNRVITLDAGHVVFRRFYSYPF